MIDAYPLSWPEGWAREEIRKSAAFKVTLAKAQGHLLSELQALGATDIIVSSNAALNRDGSISSKQGWIRDPGVAVYFTLNGAQRCVPCDRWLLIKDNIRAIGLTIEALRSLDRWGTHQVVEATFAGFSTAIEPQEVVPSLDDPWWIVIGVSQQASRDEIARAYRVWARLHHPDVGGDADLFREVTSAYQEAIRTR